MGRTHPTRSHYQPNKDQAKLMQSIDQAKINAV